MKVVVEGALPVFVVGVVRNIVFAIRRMKIEMGDNQKLMDVVTTLGGGYTGWQILQTVNWAAMGPAAEWAKLVVALVIIVMGLHAYRSPTASSAPVDPPPPTDPAPSPLNTLRSGDASKQGPPSILPKS